jgi:hypothetical protein
MLDEVLSHAGPRMQGQRMLFTNSEQALLPLITNSVPILEFSGGPSYILKKPYEAKLTREPAKLVLMGVQEPLYDRYHQVSLLCSG